MSYGSGLATGLSLGLLNSTNNTTQQIPNYVLLIAPKDTFDFEKEIGTLFPKRTTEDVEQNEEYKIKVKTQDGKNKITYYVKIVNKWDYTYYIFVVKDDESMWEINTVALLRKMIEIFNERQIKYEVWI